MAPERIEREILIDAPREVVWEVVTEPAHLEGWFPDTAAGEVRPGGELLLTWHEHGSARVRVERVEPPRELAFRWIRRTGEEPRDGNATLVELTLTAEGAGTRLRVVEHGFDALDWPEQERTRYAEENRVGWGVELDELRAYAEALVR